LWARQAVRSSNLLTPSPPAEKATARQDQDAANSAAYFALRSRSPAPQR
jgi:hypothetical protein